MLRTMITEQRGELEEAEKKQAEEKNKDRAAEEARTKVREIKIDLGMINPEKESKAQTDRKQETSKTEDSKNN